MTACPDRVPALNALFDGELDSLNAAEVEAHVRDCAGCSAYLAGLSGMRDALASAELVEPAPPALRQRIVGLIKGDAADPAIHPRRAATRYLSWIGGGAVGALAASLALLVAVPQFAQVDLTDQVIAGHIRSLQASHLTDILTSDRHVVKPWFNGRLDFSPPVVDLAQQGFPLVGGRLDYIGDHPVAALVYRRHLHTINLFVSANGRRAGAPTVLHRRTYNLLRWSAGDLEYWAVSDVGEGDLRTFQQFFQKAAAQ